MIDRPTARLLVFDETGRILLIKIEDAAISDPNAPAEFQRSHVFWVTPGGGLEPGESFEAAAHRELMEETGLTAPALGPSVLTREKLMLVNEQEVFFRERYFVARVTRTELSLDGHTELEKTVYRDHRWWSLRELETTDEVVFPEELCDLIRAHRDGSSRLMPHT